MTNNQETSSSNFEINYNAILRVKNPVPKWAIDTIVKNISKFDAYSLESLIVIHMTYLKVANDLNQVKFGLRTPAIIAKLVSGRVKKDVEEAMEYVQTNEPTANIRKLISEKFEQFYPNEYNPNVQNILREIRGKEEQYSDELETAKYVDDFYGFIRSVGAISHKFLDRVQEETGFKKGSVENYYIAYNVWQIEIKKAGGNGFVIAGFNMVFRKDQTTKELIIKVNEICGKAFDDFYGESLEEFKTLIASVNKTNKPFKTPSNSIQAVQTQPQSPEPATTLEKTESEKRKTIFGFIDSLPSGVNRENLPTADATLDSEQVDDLYKIANDFGDRQLSKGKAKEVMRRINKVMEAKDGVSRELKRSCYEAKSRIDQLIKKTGIEDYLLSLEHANLSKFEDLLLTLYTVITNTKHEQSSKSVEEIMDSSHAKLVEAKKWLTTLPAIEQDYIKNYFNGSGKASLNQLEKQTPQPQEVLTNQENKSEYLDLRDYTVSIEKLIKITDANELFKQKIELYKILPKALKKLHLNNFENVLWATNLISQLILSCGMYSNDSKNRYISYEQFIKDAESNLLELNIQYDKELDLAYRQILGPIYKMRSEKEKTPSLTPKQFLDKHFADVDHTLREEILTRPDAQFIDILESIKSYIQKPSNGKLRSIKFKINQLENKPSTNLSADQTNTETQRLISEARGNVEGLSLQQKIDRGVIEFNQIRNNDERTIETFKELVLCFEQCSDNLMSISDLAKSVKSPRELMIGSKELIILTEKRWNALFPNQQRQIEDAFPDRQVVAPAVGSQEGGGFWDLRDHSRAFEEISLRTNVETFTNLFEDSKFLKLFFDTYFTFPDGIIENRNPKNYDEVSYIMAKLVDTINKYFEYKDDPRPLIYKIDEAVANFRKTFKKATKPPTNIIESNLKQYFGPTYKTRTEILEDNIENFFVAHFIDLDSDISQELQLEIQTNDSKVYKNILKDFEEYIKDPSNKNIRSLKYKINQIIKGVQSEPSVIDNNPEHEGAIQEELENLTESSNDQYPWGDQEGVNQIDTNPQNPTSKSESDPTKPLETESKSPMENEFDSFGDKKIEDITNEASQAESRKSLVTSIDVPNKLKLFYLIAFYSQKLQEINEMSEEQRAKELKKLLNKIETDINDDKNFAARIIRRVKNVEASKNYFGQDEALSKITTIYVEEDFETSDPKPKDPKYPDKQSDDSRGQNYYEDVKDQYGDNAGMSHYITSLHDQFIEANTRVEQQIFDDGTNVFITDGMVFLVREGGSLQVVYNPDWDSDSLKLLIEDIRDQKLTGMKDFKEYCFYNGFKYISLKHSNTRAKDGSMIVDGNWKETQKKLIEDANGFVGWEINLHKNYDKRLFEELKNIFSFSEMSALTNLTVAYNNLENVKIGNSTEEEIASLTKAVDSLFKGNIDGKTFDKMSVTNKIDEMIQDQKIEESGYLDNQIVVDYIDSLRVLAIFLDNLKDFCDKADVDNNPELQKLIKDAKKLLGQFKAKNKYIKEGQILNQYTSHTFEEARYKLMLLALKSK